MTPEQSQNFIEKVLKGNWPKLVESEVDIEGWAKRLGRFDYDKAKQCVEDFKFRRTRQGLPPAGAILQAMNPAIIPKEVAHAEPVELYVIMRPDGVDLAGDPKSRRAGFPTASYRGVPVDAGKVQEDAERLCRRIAGNREGFYIKWLCEAVAPSAPF
ncbi:hypothetical protein LCGC14_0376490 [marine sediment metagenome]|uniref:Uncharacterized protein n=1 Tax=marine sediment metagenome TaxID=412755 RepID=A0A0F9WC76_9ZZZZ